MNNRREDGLWPTTWRWLIGLSSFFFISYGLANHVTSLNHQVGSVVFDWEQSIPLWPWTILPYWSIDLLYALAILLASTKIALITLGRRLLTAQVICISCFLLFPLRFNLIRPVQSGFFGKLFDLLMAFDQPFNQAPSLHITLLVVLSVFYSQRVQGYWRYLLLGWFLLIGLSVLTTWQHHFIDIPTGVLAGCFSVWLWPAHHRSPLRAAPHPKQWRLSFLYLLIATMIALLGIYLGGIGLWLCWLSVALLLVCLNYQLIGAEGFQKQPDGRFKLPILLLYLPYFMLAWINSRLWTRKIPPADWVRENVYIGRLPDRSTIRQFQFTGVVDLCAELPMPFFQGRYCVMPVLDLTLPPMVLFDQAIKVIETYQQQGRVLVCCALGYSRSAQVLIAWLLWRRHATTLNQAITILKKARPAIVISPAQRHNLATWWERNHGQ